MKNYFAYVRVSTVRQGEKGSSLQEQRAAIESYARRNALTICEWYEEMETAAKQGRPLFSKLLKALAQGRANGVIIHKIDRSARNLRDWAALGELHDCGIELHFAHESLDLNSRGGRLSADIQAVVAADYIRNLRDEIRKGFYGRLKQGLYPLPAPIGYIDQGSGVAKTIDPLRGPLIEKAYSLYATGCWSLDSLGDELYQRGLRTKTGRRVTRNSLATILHNPFYIGLIRVERTEETFPGIHPPLVDKSLFDRVQATLARRSSHKTRRHFFRYQRMLRCPTCGRALAASRHKGHVYYRCQIKTCPTTCVREELVNDVLRVAASGFVLSGEELEATAADIEAMLMDRRDDAADEQRNLSLAVAAIDDRLARLTDGYIDQIIDREIYLARKERLLNERASLTSCNPSIEPANDRIRRHVRQTLELVKALGNMGNLENEDHFRSLLQQTISNLTVSGKNVEIAWRSPFSQLASCGLVACGGPHRIKPRTGRAHDVAKIIMEHCDSLPKGGDQNDDAEPLQLAA
ncbi:MAG TPA: recombinase family protein [Xanthobacteraceae bacterium]|nr:recombinase family protein [Xanthobacteraceae bacterium]